MSTAVNPSAASPAPAPLAPAPAPPLHPEVRPSRKRWWIGALVLAAVIFAVWTLRPSQQAQKPAAVATTRTGKAVTGTVYRTLRVAGSTFARSYSNISAPMMRAPEAGRFLVLVELAKSGAFVKKGDLVTRIDAQAIIDHVDDIDALVQQAQADVRKREAEQAIEMENLRQSLRVARADLDKAKLDAGATEIRNPIDQEQLKLAVEEAEATYKQLQQDLVTTQQLHKSQLRILELTRQRHASHRDRHKADITRFTIHAPMNGLVVMQSIFRGGDMGQVQQGDQVSPGQPFIKIVDVSSMQVDATVNQSESESLRIGQPASINFDAFPDLHLTGKVEAIGALAVSGWRQNYYIRNIPVRIAISGQDPRVIPDLSASADVIIGEKPNSVMVPVESVQTENGRNFIYAKAGDTFVKRPVEIAERNHTQAAIASGVQAGEEVALHMPVAANKRY